MKTPIQIQAESRLRNAIEVVEAVMPDGVGIAVFVFERNSDKGNIGYIANAKREDMRRALTEFLGKWEADAKGAPFMPLTLDAFEAYARDQQRDDVVEVVRNYHRFSNQSALNAQEVSQQ